MELDIGVMKEVIAGMYLTKVAEEHGQPGVDALKALLGEIHRLYEYVDPGSCKTQIVVFKALQDSDRPLVGDPKRIIDLSTVTADMRGATVMQMLDGGQALLWNQTEPDCSALSASAPVYCYRDGAEAIFVRGERFPIPKVVAGVPSMFAIPTFSELAEAFEHYRVHVAAQCGCKILEQIWDGNCDKIFLRAKPEFFMRDSLCQFLSNCLRKVAHVLPEQNLGDEYPVDIKATWLRARRIALIEVKWMGKSRDSKDGHITTEYTDARAREGAKQMADYLDRNKKSAPTHVTRGWLVVFDARRKGIAESTRTISSKDGGEYRDKAIHFDPKYETVRDDFEVPVRLFMEAVCTP